jgi:outer membrane protein insertion porin family
MERAAGSFSVGLGYSQIQGLIASLSIQQDNFLGSGKRVGLSLSHSSIIDSFSLSYDNPYWNEDGVSRGFYLRYQEFNQAGANISTFTSTEAAAGMNFGFPITEVDYVRAGLGIRQTDLNIGAYVREVEFIDPDDPDNILCNDINHNGICPEEYFVVPGYNFNNPPTHRIIDPLSTSLDHNGDGIIDDKERDFRTYDLTLAWSRDTRNHFLNPTRGSSQRVSFETS